MNGTSHLVEVADESCFVRRYRTALALWFAGLGLSVGLHEFSSVDFVLQDMFYNVAADRWWVDKNAAMPRAVFYLLPKWATVATLVSLGVWLIVDRFRQQHHTVSGRSRWMVFVSLIAVTATVGLIKRYSGVWCPNELTRYGGEQTYRLLFERRSAGVPVGHCFPGGHASAGFAFLCLYYLPLSYRRRIALGIAAICLGWLMGGYQMLKGAHFLTHTLTTLCLAGLITLGVARGLRLPPRHHAR